MGSPKFPRKKYTTPLHPWKEDRIKSERELIKKYGLKNHKEVWKAKTFLGRYRHQAREILAKLGANDPQVKKESEQILLHLTRIGILPASSSLDDVLALETESVLSRRLQTLVYLKGLSTTPDHSRQLINHGHIAIDNKKVTIPGYIVVKDEENDIGFTGRSPLNELSHPARPKTDMYKSPIKPEIKEDKSVEKEIAKPIEQPKDDNKGKANVVETKESEKPKEESDKKEDKPEDIKDVKKDTTESAEKPEEKKVKEEKIEPIKEIKEKPTDEKTESVEKPEEKDIEVKDEIPEPPKEIKEKPTDEKTEPTEKPKKEKSNDKEGGK